MCHKNVCIAINHFKFALKIFPIFLEIRFEALIRFAHQIQHHPSRSLPRWFHGSISRDEAEHLLQPREDGLFLVRESTNFPGDYTLCVCFQGKVEHYRVKYLDNKLTIDDEEYFENLGQLVDVSILPFALFGHN